MGSLPRPRPRPLPPTHTGKPRKLSSKQYLYFITFFFITVNYQNSANVCFSFFFISALRSVRCSRVGTSSSGQGSITPGEGSSCPGWGAYPGYLHPGGETNCTKSASIPCGERGGASYPGFKRNRYTGSVCLFVHIVAWYTRGYMYIFTS